MPPADQLTDARVLLAQKGLHDRNRRAIGPLDRRLQRRRVEATIIRWQSRYDLNYRFKKKTTTMKPLVYLNGRFLTQKVTGVQRFSLEFVRALDKQIGEAPEKFQTRFEIITPKKGVADIRLNNIPIRAVGGSSGHVWEQFELPFYTARGSLLNLCNTAPLFKRDQFMVIHDAAVHTVPQAYSRSFRIWYKCLHTALAGRIHRILTVSEFSKHELIKYYRLRPDKIDVVCEGHDHMQRIHSDRSVIDKFQLKNKRYVLAVSSMNPNKNFKSIAQAIELLDGLDVEIVVAGGTNPKVFRANSDELPGNIKYVGYVTDQELKALYEHAFVFVFPSIYEGFGLPPIEAMACGCPTIVSDTASMPEICGDASLYCNPHRPEDIARQIKFLLSNPKTRDMLITRGFKRIRAYSWLKCALDICKSIEVAPA